MKEIKRFVDENGNEFEVEIELTTKDKIKRKVNDICSGTKKVVAGTVEFVKENPIVCIIGLAVVTKAIGSVAGSYSRVVNANTAKQALNERHRTIYDNRNGVTYRIRRQMTNDESLEFSKRRGYGEDVGEILSDMGLI